MEEYKYDLPKEEKILLDPTGNIVDNSKMKPMEVIRIIAKSSGLSIKDPNPRCKKCSGKGYIAIRASNKEPLPCDCIFDITKEALKLSKQFMASNMQLNRKDRRRQEKLMRKKGY